MISRSHIVILQEVPQEACECQVVFEWERLWCPKALAKLDWSRRLPKVDRAPIILPLLPLAGRRRASDGWARYSILDFGTTRG